MFYMYQEGIVFLLLLPVVLNVLLPLAMWGLWLITRVLVPQKRLSPDAETVEQKSIPITA
ncbi:hypothetical protein FCL47_01910 [Desulfopila sp. IMCC35006]|uniref:hypothetical protein n=1 Tax=Desulfopila sp. IMCC35006 TaxID=2569542 RepID=UPI0010AD17EF|nr:hypothetical protein [Desulfopila sp. IMCC35006]TKB28275.1 hypothetical protein FCL47_01910 [Desulfopila sp. IMCC35006]